MLEVIGVDTLDALAEKALPAGILDALTAEGVSPGLEFLPPPASSVTSPPPRMCANFAPFARSGASPRHGLEAGLRQTSLSPRTRGPVRPVQDLASSRNSEERWLRCRRRDEKRTSCC